MIGTDVGAYHIEAELGAGGMGTVYRARGTGGDVALKLVHDHLLEQPGVLDRFRREAEVGKQVVHDNVVRTLDVGAFGSRQFLVMEFVEGQTLRALLQEMEALPEELCRHIGREIAAALEGIHGAGIIHRDLKPENILVTRDHVVKVMDLGLARVRDEAQRLSRAGEFAGSVHYAAPEQFLRGGDALDGRTDLYALGLTLYELAAGRHPFLDGDLAAVMHKQISETPPRLSERNPQLTPFFEEVVATLLSKDPDDRFPDAATLRAVFEQGEESAWWQRRADDIVAATRKPLRRIRMPRETMLYGREAQIDALRRAYDAGGVVLLRGEAGVGKTRLVDEFIARLERDGAALHFLFGTSPPGGAATATGALVQAFAPMRARLEELLPAAPVRDAFVALLEDQAPPTGVPPLTKETMQAAFQRGLAALAAEQPVVLLVDDLHFAPEEGRALFASLAAAAADHRALLVGTLRPGVSAEWLGELERLPHVSLLDVPRLGPKDLHALLTDALGSARLAEQLGGQIAWKSDGNPFFVFEILQGLRDDGLLRERDGSWVRTGVIENLTVPSSLRDLIRARIAGLDEEDRLLLEVAACDGYEFDPTAIAEVLDMKRIPLLRRLAHLEKQHRLVHAAGRMFRFDHHQVQEALYEELNELLREEYHAALGAVFEARGGDPVALAEHFLKGGQGARALAHLVPALEKLDVSHRNTAAIALAERALAAPGLLAGSARAEVLDHLGSRHNVLGHYEAAAAAFEEMRRCAEEADDVPNQLAAGAMLGNLWVNVARFADAERISARTVSCARAHGHPKGRAGAGIILGNALMYQGRFEECIAAYADAIESGKDVDEAMVRIGAIGNQGFALACVGRYREAFEYSARAMRLSDEDPWGLAINLGYRAAFFRDLGVYERAREAGEAQLARARDMSYRWGDATARHEVAAVDEETGDHRAAADGYEAALEIRRDLGDSAGIAETLVALGRLRDDRATLEEARALAESIGTPTPLALAAALLGDARPDLMPRVRRRQAIEIHRALGDDAAARAALAAWDLPAETALDRVPLYSGLR